MKKYNHITKEDRNTIEHLIKHNNSCRDIAEVLSRNESTIRREILRNRTLVEPNKFNNHYLKYCECSNIFLMSVELVQLELEAGITVTTTRPRMHKQSTNLQLDR